MLLVEDYTIAKEQTYEKISIIVIDTTPELNINKQNYLNNPERNEMALIREDFPEGWVILTDGPETLDWGVDETEADLVWGITDHAVDISGDHIATGIGVKVAVMDIGIDIDHPDIDANIKGGWNFDDGNSNIDTSGPHGTFCAGIIAAEDNDLDESVIGVAPLAHLYGLKVNLEADYPNVDTYIKPYEDVYNAINWARNHEIRIISMSFSLPEQANPDYIDVEDLEAIINTAWNEGIVIITSAGNNNEDIENSLFPYTQKFDNVITVGAIDDNDERWEEGPGSGSSYGDELDIVAPGVNIRSCISIEPYWRAESCTSVATPMVAGVCALILEVQPSLNADQVRDILFMTSENIGDSYYYGHGKVDASKAVDAALLYFDDSDNDGLSYYEEKYIYLTFVNDADSDNDGIMDGDEIHTYNTNPLESDTDNDYLEDGWEVTHINPVTGEYFNATDFTDGQTDHDNDFISTGYEVSIYGTDWNDADTDNDGLDDGQEVYGVNVPGLGLRYTDPADSDTDNDGLTDGLEVNGLVFGEYGTFYTDPTNSDCDSDGLSDRMEQIIGIIPFDQDTDNDGYTDFEEICANTDPTDPDSNPGGGGGFLP